MFTCYYSFILYFASEWKCGVVQDLQVLNLKEVAHYECWAQRKIREMHLSKILCPFSAARQEYGFVNKAVVLGSGCLFVCVYSFTGIMQYEVPEDQDLKNGEEFIVAVKPDRLTLWLLPFPLCCVCFSPCCFRSIDVSVIRSIGYNTCAYNGRLEVTLETWIRSFIWRRFTVSS